MGEEERDILFFTYLFFSHNLRPQIYLNNIDVTDSDFEATLKFQGSILRCPTRTCGLIRVSDLDAERGNIKVHSTAYGSLSIAEDISPTEMHKVFFWGGYLILFGLF